jgi:hypothetical protein
MSARKVCTQGLHATRTDARSVPAFLGAAQRAVTCAHHTVLPRRHQSDTAKQRDCVSAGKTAAVSLLVVVTGPMASGERTVAPSRGVRLRAADRSTDEVADVIQREHQ